MFLEERTAGIASYAAAYLPGTQWTAHDVQAGFGFGLDARFGHEQCGCLEDDDSGRSYRFPLVSTNTSSIVLTVSVLLMLLNDAVDEHGPSLSSNRPQLMAFSTRCASESDAPMGWGHMISGKAYPPMRRWLSDRVRLGGSDPLSAVRKAMREAYTSLDPERGKLFVDMCDARLDPSGRFLLECPGNACDVAIYPESDYGPDADGPTAVSCHNLDSAPQQLTLLAGLAVLHQLAEADLG